MNILIDTEKYLPETTTFHDKTHNKLGIEDTFLSQSNKGNLLKTHI